MGTLGSGMFGLTTPNPYLVQSRIRTLRKGKTEDYLRSVEATITGITRLKDHRRC